MNIIIKGRKCYKKCLTTSYSASMEPQIHIYKTLTLL